MKTTVDIPDELLERARDLARRHRMTLKMLTEEGLRLAIERLEQRQPVVIEPHVVTGRPLPRDLTWRRLEDALYGNEGAEVRGES